MKFWWYLSLLLLLPVVSADWDSQFACRLSQNCSITIFTANNSNSFQILNVSSCFITVWNNDDFGTYLIFNASMSQPNISQGLFNYTILFNDTGHYPSLVQCNGTDVNDSKEVSFEVINQTNIFNSTGFFGGSSTSSHWATAVMIALLTVVAILSYYSIKLVNLNKYLRLLLFLAAFLMLIITVNVATSVVEIQSATSTDVITLLDTTHMVLVWMFIAVFGVLFILFLFGIIDNIRKNKGDITP